jgi:hypothetical protein
MTYGPPPIGHQPPVSPNGAAKAPAILSIVIGVAVIGIGLWFGTIPFPGMPYVFGIYGRAISWTWIVFTVVGSVLGVLLIVGAILLLNRKAAGRVLALIGTFLCIGAAIWGGIRSLGFVVYHHPTLSSTAGIVLAGSIGLAVLSTADVILMLLPKVGIALRGQPKPQGPFMPMGFPPPHQGQFPAQFPQQLPPQQYPPQQQFPPQQFPQQQAPQPYPPQQFPQQPFPQQPPPPAR